VPARPFVVGPNVLWFASNSGAYASVGTGGQDIRQQCVRFYP
jgi:hypothetical protein